MKIDWSKVEQPDFVPFRFPSRRSVVYGTKGVVAASQPLAVEAGLEILRKGGNAGDKQSILAGDQNWSGTHVILSRCGSRNIRRAQCNRA